TAAVPGPPAPPGPQGRTAPTATTGPAGRKARQAREASKANRAHKANRDRPGRKANKARRDRAANADPEANKARPGRPAPTDTRHKRATTAPKPGGCASPTRRNSPMSWRVARSLETLRDQINARYPNRNRASDGTIGDAAHATRDSDHNPWVRDGRLGVVTALDITHDPAHGVDIDRLTDELQASRDPRIKYVIANGLIMDTRPGFNPWRWVRYTGSNRHTRHFHLQVMPDTGRYDDT